MSVNQQGWSSSPQRRAEEFPRPVVTFLLNRCRLSLRQALVDCLRELDNEGLVRFETQGGTPVISLVADQPQSGRVLLPYEEVALDRVRTRAGRQADAPLSVLLSDDGDDYKRWAGRQVNEIGMEARRAGLARKRHPRHTWAAVFSLIALVICTALVVHGAHPKASGVVGGFAVAAVIVLLCAPIRLYRWRLTPEGAAAVDSWRRDGVGVPGAVPGTGAMGERTILGLTAPSGDPLPPGHAWSSLGGQWHTVRLGEELKRPFWSGLPGLGAALSLTAMGSFFSAIIGWAVGFNHDGKLIAFAPAALCAFAVLVGWLPAFVIRMGLPDNVTLTGEVVRKWHVDGGEYSPDHDWVCVDNGSPTAMKFDVGTGTYYQLSVGGRVQVSWSPRHGRLNDIHPVS
jgi:hypothetical protein